MLDSLCSKVPAELLVFAVALVVVLVSGPAVIKLLARYCRETIRQDSTRLAALLSPKAATPTMGGVLILAGFAMAVCCGGQLARPTTWAALALPVLLSGIGMWDDLCKRRTRRGISARKKLFAQAIVALPIVLWLAAVGAVDGDAVSLAFALLLIVGMSNAVNLTDGLDGLAGGCCLLFLMSAAVIAGSFSTDSEMQLPIAALAGSVLGFLWFNRHPARVFMGDTGSLALGGLLGLFIVLSEHKLSLLIACGVFLAEAASVVVQVSWFRAVGRRVFLCAPLHHHFQFLGWRERRIVAHFWLAGLLFALLGCLVLVSRPEGTVMASTNAIRPQPAQP